MLLAVSPWAILVGVLALMGGLQLSGDLACLVQECLPRPGGVRGLDNPNGSAFDHVPTTEYGPAAQRRGRERREAVRRGAHA